MEACIYRRWGMRWSSAVMMALAAAAAPLGAQGNTVHYELPGTDRVTVTRNIVYRRVGAGSDTLSLALDVYRAPDTARARRPALVFVHGGLIAGNRPVAKDWPSYQSWGRLAAATGLVGITFDHRLNTNDNVVEATGDLRALLDHVRSNSAALGVDPDRLCLAIYSAGGVLANLPLRERPAYVRCVILYYPYLDLEHLRVQSPFRPPHPPAHVDSLMTYSPAALVWRDPATLPPIFLAMAGNDSIPRLNESVERFMRAAVAAHAPLDFLIHPTGLHGFDVRTRDTRTRDIVEASLRFAQRHLGR
jgi:acetyl esterase/lipase